MQCKITHLLEAYDIILSYLKRDKNTDVIVFWCLCRAGKENSLNVIGADDELK